MSIDNNQMAPTVDTWTGTTTHRPVMPSLTNLWLCSIGQSLIASRDLLKAQCQYSTLSAWWIDSSLDCGDAHYVGIDQERALWSDSYNRLSCSHKARTDQSLL